ncbi:TPA: hypothetical protein NIK62_003264 [Vibrio cholerae]|uniref:hypothetical protein n=1 Tax=Vibrio cholerae TaxID=666 RepID=UPI00005F4AA2|nr:hypothetical protein [Vibrio cholerae]EMC8699338.1 hypothetical protein [Vibrio cholerae]KFD93455.1 hypothetical protein DN33_3492 [Vibrio cholerae]KNA52218.1 hypothetical protein VCV51_033476 [Vibrio cholerae V51]GIB75257.1 Hypothetical protein VCSRO141_3497 [Vibrio cholerae]HCF7742668.1 hypothetical protein [Vibrio cholerae]
MVQSSEQTEKEMMIKVAKGILGLWASSLLLLFFSPEARGTFGDMFGAVNALFSGFAFLGVIYAILLQKTELKLQREELALTRDELAKSANAQEKSEESLRLQAEAMSKTATINVLTASIESLEKRISFLPTYGETQKMQGIAKQREQMESKVKKISEKLDSLVDDTLK